MTRDKQVQVRFSDETHDRLKNRAEQSGLNTSTFIRHKIKTEILKPKVEA